MFQQFKCNIGIITTINYAKKRKRSEVIYLLQAMTTAVVFIVAINILTMCTFFFYYWSNTFDKRTLLENYLASCAKEKIKKNRTCKLLNAKYVKPPWRNGLACWTSNSKVVGSSPTGGGVFLPP